MLTVWCRDWDQTLVTLLSNTVFILPSTAALLPPPLRPPEAGLGGAEGRGEGQGRGHRGSVLRRQQAALRGLPLHQVVQGEQKGLRLQSSGGLQQGNCPQYHH